MMRTSCHGNYQQGEIKVPQRAGTRHCHLFTFIQGEFDYVARERKKGRSL